jgi:ribosomal-protein-alanine N-acetyltransferase
MGFNEIGLRKNYYPARRGREDALVLARDLGDGLGIMRR